MTPGVQVSGEQTSDMQLAARVALSAAAFLLLTLAYRYYKSRVPCGSQQGASGERGKGSKDAEGTESMVCCREEELPPGLRHRWVNSKGEKPNHRAGGNPPLRAPGPAVFGESRGQNTPACREPDGEKEVKKQEKERMSHLGSGLPPDRKCSVAEEEKGGETSGAVLSNGNTAAVTETAKESEGRLPSLGLLSPEGSFCSLNGSHKDVSSAEDGLCLAAQEEGSGHAALHPADENGSTLGGGRSDPPGEEERQHLAPTQEEQERTRPSFHATSDMGLKMNHSHAGSHTTYMFSSVAQVQVEESLVKERKFQENSNGQPGVPGTSLRGKVYDYYVQSISQSVLKEMPSCTSLGTQPFSQLPVINIPDASDERLGQESAQSSAVEDDPEDVPSPGALPHLIQDETKPRQPGSQDEAAVQERRSKKPPGPGAGSFSRKDSLHQIIDNPELQVPMEGFGCLASGLSGLDTPPLSPLRSSSVSSLVGSMQSLQSDTSEEPTVELVAGAKFFHIPLSSESSIDIHLDLGNCYEVLCMAKKQKLETLREAAYKVMSDNYLQVLRTHAIYSRLNGMERDLILQRRMRGRKYVAVADVSSQGENQHASRLCYYDDQKDTWHLLTHVPLEVVSKGCAMCSMFNYLFVAAGCEGRGRRQKPSNRVFCYNPLTNIWREICPLNQARPHCKLVALDGYLYAIGGECLYTVERYDPRLDRWTFAAPLPNDTFAVAHTATACDGEIYVTGGTLRYMLLRYVGQTDTWKFSLTGGNKDRTTEMVTVNGFIYRFDLNRSMGISVYRCGARAKLWYECATHPMPFLTSFQCAVVENLVYCIGRQFNIRFLADYVSPRFGTKELQTFPSPRGTLSPVTLVLPDREVVQTRV
ncbi:domain-containing 7A [Podarcis lilfordi]|uniref:Domain-containing 7A n=1 Tax=Podarcis lilfordi TaxID=74358 RepID=A0AA35PEJ2_9SAUR|nr:domain-containing 7A [Podarcis lilfordi]